MVSALSLLFSAAHGAAGGSDAVHKLLTNRDRQAIDRQLTGSRSTRRARGGDFCLATSGGFFVAPYGDFLMATDSPSVRSDRAFSSHGSPVDTVVSVLQKEIRRSHVDNAVLAAHEMVTTSPDVAAYLWRRLRQLAIPCRQRLAQAPRDEYAQNMDRGYSRPAMAYRCPRPKGTEPGTDEPRGQRLMSTLSALV